MRNTFLNTLSELAATNERIVFLTGDLGFSVVEKFRETYPNRFFNFGIMEQCMTGAAAGLALSGKKAVTYSIAPFVTMRPFEQVRDDIAAQDADVLIVGVGAGLPYSSYGPTHQATEDIAIMRLLPNMVVLCPGDPVEARLATIAAIKHHGPVYLRLGKGKEKIVHQTTPEFQIGKAIVMRDGNDVTLISSGDGLVTAAKAVEQLVAEGIDVRFLSMPSIKPIDKDAILRAARETKRIVTFEEHQAVGGLGGAVAEIVANEVIGALVTRIGIPDKFTHHAGSQEHLRKGYGLTVENIIRQIKGE